MLCRAIWRSGHGLFDGGGEGLPPRPRPVSRPPPSAGTPRNAPEAESGRRACSVPPRAAAPTGPPLTGAFRRCRPLDGASCHGLRPGSLRSSSYRSPTGPAHCANELAVAPLRPGALVDGVADEIDPDCALLGLADRDKLALAIELEQAADHAAVLGRGFGEVRRSSVCIRPLQPRLRPRRRRPRQAHRNGARTATAGAHNWTGVIFAGTGSRTLASRPIPMCAKAGTRP